MANTRKGTRQESVTVEVLLDCGHKHTFTKPHPRRNDFVLCASCNESATVIHVYSNDKFSFRCAGCTTHGEYGSAQLERTRLAQRHISTTQHSVYLIKNGEIERVLQGSGSAGYFQPSIMEAQLPPF